MITLGPLVRARAHSTPTIGCDINLSIIIISKLNGGNMMKAINTWAVAAVRYTAGIVEWKVDERKEMDRKT